MFVLPSGCMLPQTTPIEREIELDFIRGVAILMVLVSHYRSHNLLVTSYAANRIEGFGWAGVDIFFVLSGFLVGGLLLREWILMGSAWAILSLGCPSRHLLIRNLLVACKRGAPS